MHGTNRKRRPAAAEVLAIALAGLIGLQACAHRSIVQVRPPYEQKVSPGDGVKITMRNGTRYAGRVVYADRSVVVIRTPEQVERQKPVKSVKFGETIRWEDVRAVRVAGTLDSQGKLISNEEIRVNRRTNHRRNMVINLGLLGSAVSFLAATAIQDGISPASADVTQDDHGRGRLWFWTTWAAGTAASALLGRQYGHYLDWRASVARIERQRAVLRASVLDSLSPQADGLGEAGGP